MGSKCCEKCPHFWYFTWVICACLITCVITIVAIYFIVLGANTDRFHNIDLYKYILIIKIDIMRQLILGMNIVTNLMMRIYILCMCFIITNLILKNII